MKKVLFLFGGILILGSLALGFAYGNKIRAPGTSYVVRAGTITGVVKATGIVTSSQNVELSFDKGREVVAIRKAVGEYVDKGDIIIQLSNRDLIARITQAQASLLQEQGKLKTLIQPVATSSPATTIPNLNMVLRAGTVAATKAVYDTIDIFFDNPRSAAPTLVFDAPPGIKMSVESGRVEVERRLQSMTSLISTIATSTPDTSLASVSLSMKQDLGEIRLFIDNLSSGISTLTATGTLSQSTLDQWRSKVSEARTAINSAVTDIFVIENKMIANLPVATSTVVNSSVEVGEAIRIQKQKIATIQALIRSLTTLRDKTYMVSPISGLITRQDVHLGETIATTSPIVSIVSDTKFQINATTTEAQRTFLAVGQKAEVRFNSSDQALPATVVSSYPGLILQFDAVDERVTLGAPVEVVISGDTHTDTLLVPERAIITHEDGTYVKVEHTETSQEVKVQTGLRSHDGFVEIVDGLHPEDVVVLFL